MKASVEWIRSDVAIVRGGPEFETLGDPYAFACTVVLFTSTYGHVKGLAGNLGPNPLLVFHMLKKLAASQGILTTEWERKRSNHTKHVFCGRSP